MSRIVGLVESGVRGTVRGHFRKALPILNGRTPTSIAADDLDAIFRHHNLIAATRFQMIWLTCSIGHFDYSIVYDQSGPIENGREFEVKIRFDARDADDKPAAELLRRACVLESEALLFFLSTSSAPDGALREYRERLGELRIVRTSGRERVVGSYELAIECSSDKWGSDSSVPRLEKLQKLASSVLKAEDIGDCGYYDVNQGEASLYVQVKNIDEAIRILKTVLAKPSCAMGVRIVDMDGNVRWSRD